MRAPPRGTADRRLEVLARAGCHLAAALPLVVGCLANLVAGWRPMFDNAALSWRAFDVLSGSPPLVGASTNPVPGSHLVAFAPGPAEFFLLAVPVRLDPTQGALWGALLLALVAVAVAVEAAWAVAGWRGAALVAASVAWLVVTWPAVAVDPVWNPWMGTFFLVAALSCSWATASGRLRWWPVAVGAASVAAQCHEIFAPPALGAAAVALVVGWLQGRRQGRGFSSGPVLSGVGVGVALWLAPLVQQLTGRPGNLGQLARVARLPVAHLGVAKALTAFGGASRPFPVWMHRPPSGSALAGFAAVLQAFSGSEWWGATALALLAMIAVVAWRRGHSSLCAGASVSLVAAVGTVAGLAGVPSRQFLSLVYLDVVLWPTGIAAWLTLLAGGGWASAALLRRLTASPWTSRASSLMAPGGAVVLGLGALAGVWASVGALSDSQATLSGWWAVRQAQQVTTVAVHLAPPGPFNLVASGPSAFTNVSVVAYVAYLLHVQGQRPLFAFDPSVGLAVTSRPDLATLSLRLAGHGGRPHVAVEAAVPRGRRAGHGAHAVSTSGP